MRLCWDHGSQESPFVVRFIKPVYTSPEILGTVRFVRIYLKIIIILSNVKLHSTSIILSNEKGKKYHNKILYTGLIGETKMHSIEKTAKNSARISFKFSKWLFSNLLTWAFITQFLLSDC